MANELLEERLSTIVAAVGGRNVETDGEEIWFEADRVPGLQVRLSSDPNARCYGRSANFGISYGGQPSNVPVPAAFLEIVRRIQKIDAVTIEGAAGAFRAAAEGLAGGLTNPETESAGLAEPVQRHEEQPPETAPLDPTDDEENAIFLDFCSQLYGGRGGSLLPMHWGFWPNGATEASDPEDFGPWAAFTENLLTYVPPNVTRILDVGCGLGFTAQLLSAKKKRVTALSPVAHHCALIEAANLPGVDVVCTRFEELQPGPRYDLLLFSESLNYFAPDESFLQHCKQFLSEGGFVLIADDLSPERARMLETQRVFRILRSVDISENVAPTTIQWARRMRLFAAYHTALMSVVNRQDPELGARIEQILGNVRNNELRLLFSGLTTPPSSQGRYMIYLLKLTGSAA